MTVEAFMDLALYDPGFGYYARAAQRTGRSGDFFTSVDVGPLFGELLALQIHEMAVYLAYPPPAPAGQSSANPSHTTGFDIVEAGAGNGRLARDVLRALRRHDPALYDSVRLHLVEASASARTAQAVVLDDVGDRLVGSGETLPDSFTGVLIANELLDAMPVHQVVMRENGLREVFVDDGEQGLRLIEGPISTAALQQYLDRAGVRLDLGRRAEINLRAIAWIREAARRLHRGFMILIDYGHEARELYSVTHGDGTLTSFQAHRSSGVDEGLTPAWLSNPGAQDITAHVDFTSVRAAAEAEGMETIAFLDQTYFLLGLYQSLPAAAAAGGAGKAPAERQLKTLIMPGGLGSTMKVLILGKNVGRPQLAGCSFKVRVT
jgi:SAM-dependent MidA family methyltransferase